ncbi:MAG: ATP-dependent sacrificial sulfur transferase LarE [Bacteroidales bacterium]|nr:ATP-dependent sacrificial sulfur transferase LarE [Bacteroidales bacterium]
MKSIEYYNKLMAWYMEIDKAIVAFSGGIDSCLVLFAARQSLGRDNTVAVISNSASLKNRDLTIARDFCTQFDIQLLEVDAGEIENMNYRSNPINRCYFCKTALYETIDRLCGTHYKGFTPLNGSNIGDFGDFRPGLKAAGEFAVRSPLAECKFDKKIIRMVAQDLGLPTWDKPASPCLSSRFPYGEEITEKKLKMVEMGEEILYLYGFKNSRVRFKDGMASIEVENNLVRKLDGIKIQLSKKLKAIGFKGITIDKDGFRTGKLNDNLSKEELKPWLVQNE